MKKGSTLLNPFIVLQDYLLTYVLCVDMSVGGSPALNPRNTRSSTNNYLGTGPTQQIEISPGKNTIGFHCQLFIFYRIEQNSQPLILFNQGGDVKLRPKVRNNILLEYNLQVLFTNKNPALSQNFNLLPKSILLIY